MAPHSRKDRKYYNIIERYDEIAGVLIFLSIVFVIFAAGQGS